MRAEELFYLMPREVGNPFRSVVYSLRELREFIRNNNYVNPVFVALYSTDLTVDKIFFDIDAKVLEDAYDEVSKLIDNIKSIGADYIPVFSGRKGFHIYIPCKAIKLSGKELRSVQEYISDGVKVDTHCFGDLRRLVRFPNTFNVTRYATPLPKDFIDTMTVDDILEYSKTTRVIDYCLSLIDLSKYCDDDDFEEVIECETSKCAKIPVIDASLFVRPCVLEIVTKVDEPPHTVRFSLVTELMWSGFDEESIFDFIKSLDWIDFDETITRQQISHIFANKYFPPSCDKLSAYTDKCKECKFRFSKYFLEVV